MNVSSECVDNFHYYNHLELLLLILVCIHMSCFVYFGKNVVPIGHWNSFRLVLESHGKVVENDFPKRVATLKWGGSICWLMTDAEVPIVPSQSRHRWPSDAWDSWQWRLVRPWTRQADIWLHSSTTSRMSSLLTFTLPPWSDVSFGTHCHCWLHDSSDVKRFFTGRKLFFTGKKSDSVLTADQ